MNPMQFKSAEERKAIAAKGHRTRRERKEAIIKQETQARLDAVAYADGLGEKIAALEARLKFIEQVDQLATLSTSLTGKRLLHEKEIVNGSVRWSKPSGIYFLILNDSVVYVGQSVNVFSRIEQHRDKKFDSYAYVACDIESLDILESLYIHCLKPTINGNQSNGAKSAPLSLDDMMQGLTKKHEFFNRRF